MIVEKQIALVTGAASGLGAAAARALARAGARVAVMDINVDALSALSSEIGGLPMACDISNATSAEEAFAYLTEIWGAPRIVVNCAGIAPPGRIVGRKGPLSLDAFMTVVSVNLGGTFNILRLAAAAMSALEPLETGERGVIINTASIAAYDGQIGQAAYAASKGGVVALTLPAARELARTAIRVVTIAPGIFATPLLEKLPEEGIQALEKTVPFPSRLGNPEEFARLALHIVDNVMLNGEVIRLDGALRMAPQ